MINIIIIAIIIIDLYLMEYLYNKLFTISNNNNNLQYSMYIKIITITKINITISCICNKLYICHIYFIIKFLFCLYCISKDIVY